MNKHSGPGLEERSNGQGEEISRFSQGVPLDRPLGPQRREAAATLGGTALSGERGKWRDFGFSGLKTEACLWHGQKT